MNINHDKYNELIQYYNDSNGVNAVFMIGHKGLGKSYIAREFLKRQTNILHFSVYDKSPYVLEPIISTINMYNSYNGGNTVLDSNNGLNITENINRALLSICRNGTILYFENIAYYEYDLLIYIKQFIERLKHYYEESETFIIFDIDTDNRDVEFIKKLEILYSVSPDFEFINFKALSIENLEEYFFHTFRNKIDIEKSDLNYILNSSMGNLSTLNIIISYLKQNELIKKDGEKYRCYNIPKGMLAHALYNNIMHRYKLLTPELQKLLSQSSIIGVSFDCSLLYNTFNILEAHEQLKRIEKVSSLIHEEDLSIYHFENFDVHKVIFNTALPSEKQQWHKLIVKYYQKILKMTSNLSLEKKMNILYKLAFHNKECLNYNKSIYYYIKLINIDMNIMDYNQALIYIYEINTMIDYISAKETVLSILIQYEADAHRLLGSYSTAIDLYHKSLNEYSEMYTESETQQIYLHLAYSYYMNGYVPQALEISLEIKPKLKSSNPKMYYDVLSFLSSIYHLRGEDYIAQEYYIETLNFCKNNALKKEYYIQLKKSSMIFDLEVSLPMIESAIKYFENIGNIRELAETLHNYATDNLYLVRYNTILFDCEKSISLFKKFGSILVHYPMNTKGIYEAVVNKNYTLSIDIFKTILQYDVESFSMISVYSNLATCYRLLGRNEECVQCLENADVLIDLSENEDIILLKTYHYINWALYYKTTHSFNKALSLLYECQNNIQLQDRHKYIVYHQIDKICSILQTNVPKIIADCLEEKSYPLLDTYVENDYFFATMRFYE